MAAKSNIVLGVSGGIAAFKAVALASHLAVRGKCVRTVMTENAGHLVGPKSFQAVTAQPVFTSLWETTDRPSIEHIDLAHWADIVVVAPATADILAKAAHGLCDDLLSTLLCAAWQKTILLAPAMNTRMWQNPITQKNLGLLKDIGYHCVGPAVGRMACGDEGPGRMAEPEQIIQAMDAL